MSAPRVYLDHNATTPLRPEARNAMLAAMDLCGSASSVHAEGRAARAVVEEAREAVAALVGAQPRNVVFVSGATEANAMALTPHWQRGADRRPLTQALLSAVEHTSALHAPRFAAVEHGPVDRDGVADLPAWTRRLDELAAAGERPLVSLMLANNETGVLQPVPGLAGPVHAAGGLLHTDVAQAAGKVPVSMAALGVDLLTLSAHKLGGPQGIGALVLGSADLHPMDPLIPGGQERGRRGGTEPLVALAGFAAAAEAARRDLGREAIRLAALRDRLEAGLLAIHPGLCIAGRAAPRLPNTTCCAAPGATSAVYLAAFDLQHVAGSAGSACSSGKVGTSHVLAAMGFSPGQAASAMRLSLGWTTQADDIDRTLSAWSRLVDSLSEGRRNRAA